MKYSVILSIVTALSAIMGGVFGAYFQSRFQHKKEVEEDIHQLKRKRYGSILIQMLTILNPDSLQKHSNFEMILKT
ncbi:MAG: hypothetical protein LHV68_07075 [Elusimicrobia bacterium]|nr:hypothetical protein [Candidatus Liberimonas magnetica]